jgi:hypothetical protein
MRSFSIENDRGLLTPREFYKRLQKMNPGDPKNHWVLKPVGIENIWKRGVIIISDRSVETLNRLGGPELTIVPLTLIDEDPVGYYAWI